MSDEHLAIILRGIKARLEIALRQASECLPEEERLTHAVHVVDDCQPYILHLPCDDDTHWLERVSFHPIALNPVASLVDELAHEIGLLVQAPKKATAPITARAKVKSAKKQATKKAGN